MMHKIHALLLLSAAILVAWAPCVRGDEKSAKATLVEKGVRVTKSTLAVTEEASLVKGIREATSLKKKLKSALKSLNELEQEEEAAKQNVQALVRQNIGLSQQLKNTSPTNVVEYNSSVADLKTNDGAIRLLDESRKDSGKQLDEARKAFNAARETYVEKVLELKTQPDRIRARYADLSKDKDAQAALGEWNASLPKPLAFEPSRGFPSALKRLEALEKTIDSEKIASRRQGGGLFVSVVINGKQPQEMMVDTGCTLMSLPRDVAVQCGARLDTGREAKFHIADGSTVNGKIVTLDSVRVGKFIVNNVECGVCLSDAGNVPALLGMSFLGRFKVELLNGAELVLTNVDGTAGISGGKNSVKRTSSKHTPRRTGASTP